MKGIAALALGAGTATTATPQPLPGWPKAVPAGPILDGPLTGTSVTVVTQDGARVFTVAAYRADGRRLWVNLALDGATGAVLWTRAGPSQVLTGLEYGVLAERAGGLVAIGGAAEELWARGLPAGQGAAAYSVELDEGRGRLYLGRLAANRPGVTAVNALTGAQIWRTRPLDRARPLSVGRSGRVYLAIDRPGRTAVRAVRLTDGATVWQRRTGLAVLGALELRNRTVAVSAGSGRFAGSRGGRLTILDPRRIAR